LRRRPRNAHSSEDVDQSTPRKSASLRRKGKETRPNYKETDSVAYAALRQKDWYEEVERDFDIEDPRFWCMEH
jgi:hypothetical protein